MGKTTHLSFASRSSSSIELLIDVIAFFEIVMGIGEHSMLLISSLFAYSSSSAKSNVYVYK
jgi:hypothetical protein